MRGAIRILAMALILAACGTETSADTSTTESQETTTTQSVTTSSEMTTTTTTEATTTTTVAASGGGESCLVGRWELDSEAFMESLANVFAAEGSAEGVVVELVGGSYIVTMNDDGTFIGTRDEWSFQAVTAEGTFRLTVDGMDEGTWSVEGSTLMVETTESSATVSAQAVVDGEVLDLPSGAAPTVQSDAVAESSSFSCGENRLTVTVDEGFVSEFDRLDG